MLMTLSFLTLLTRIPFAVTIFRSCAPNTKFLLNGRLCLCNNLGQFNDASCQLITRKQLCQPGQIIWEQCSQCICQENGQYICTNSQCSEDTIKSRPAIRSPSGDLCTPFKSYFMNCSLCVCPASGQMIGARCAKDNSCTLKNIKSFESIPHNICIPKVMYLFNCLHCLCSDDGRFYKSKCTSTCHPDMRRKCVAKSFYRSHCNICYCPNNGLQDKTLCSNSTCHKSNKMKSLQLLKNVQHSCSTNKFTKAKCMFCECNLRGSINEQSCMEQECLKTEFSYDTVKSKCSRSEMVPTCMECFCPRSNLTTEKYCTTGCSLQRRLSILENVLKEKVNLIDRSAVKDTEGTDSCDPDSLYLDQGRYCLCSADGDTSLKQCTSVLEQVRPKKSSKFFVDRNIELHKADLNISCEPNSYIEIGCNTCYCNRHGKVDPKWCTSDDCEAKKIVLENNNKLFHTTKSKTPNGSDTITCVPGSISRLDCNFCICSNSGLMAERACTKNVCDRHQIKAHGDEQHCEPLAYYLAGCNVCYCPSDGIKNVNRCTKNQCEDNFLRSNACKPGDLFSDECKICVCPPSGDKTARVCTNRTCDENDTPWKKIFKISRPELFNHVAAAPTKNFEPCFPGEEFEIGCKVCVCPEMGLKEYATCTTILCDEPSIVDPTREEMGMEEMDRFKEDRHDDLGVRMSRVRRQQVQEDDISDENCKTFNITDGTENKLCTPGSEYIIKCKVCICPYIGSISQFCRPMPVDRYCEQAYPGFNFSPMARRHVIKGNSTVSNGTVIQQNITQIYIPHNHTKYSCEEPEVINNECHICKCEDKVLIEEHCFKSDAENCTHLTEPAFLKSYRRIN